MGKEIRQRERQNIRQSDAAVRRETKGGRRRKGGIRREVKGGS